MATYGLDIYGASTYGDDDAVVFRTTVLVVCPDYYHLRVTWTPPGGTWTSQRLVRNASGVPSTVTDGVVMVETSSNAEATYDDFAVLAGKAYHYAVFVYSPESLGWVRCGSGSALVTKNYGYTDMLWNRLPGVYKIKNFQNITASPDMDHPLYKFLSVFGFQLDVIRTEYDALLHVTAKDVPAVALTALLGQLGFGAEPELEARSRRQLAANAADLYVDKGSAAGLENLANVITDWDAGVYLGPNKLLDNLDALTDLSVGRWDTVTTGCSVQPRNNDAAGVSGSYGRAYMVVTPDVSGGALAVSFSKEGRFGRLHSVPIVQSRVYCGSVYARGSNMARIAIDFYDINGTLIGSFEGDNTTLSDSVWTRLTTVRTSPPGVALASVGARYAALRVISDAATTPLLLNAAQLEETPTGAPTVYTPARRVLVALRADLVNEVYNPGSNADSITGITSWEGDVTGLSFAADQGFLFNWSNGNQVSALDRRIVSPLPRVPVVPGATYTVLAQMRAASTAEIGDDVDADFSVEIDVGWQVRRFSGGAEIPAAHAADTDFVKLTRVVTAADPLGGVDVWVPVSFSYTVPDDGSVTSIQVGVAITRQRFTQIGALRSRPDGSPGIAQLSATGLLLAKPVAGAYSNPLPGSSWLDAVRFRDVALVKGSVSEAFYFSGSSASTSADYLWEGTPNASRSHYYSNRTVKAQRFRALAVEFLPHPQVYWDDETYQRSLELLFAQTTADGMLPAWGMENYDTNPSGGPTVVVGTSLGVQWYRERMWSELIAAGLTWDQIIALYPEWNDINGV